MTSIYTRAREYIMIHKIASTTALVAVLSPAASGVQPMTRLTVAANKEGTYVRRARTQGPVLRSNAVGQYTTPDTTKLVTSPRARRTDGVSPAAALAKSVSRLKLAS